MPLKHLPWLRLAIKAGNIQYSLPDGPCEQVIRGKLYNYPTECRQIFPKNKTIVQFNVEGYLGYPLFDVDGKPFGLIAVMHEKEIEDPEHVSSLLKIVAKRAEFELERMKHERELDRMYDDLKQKNQQLENRNAELASFSYIASHDLQEPLRKIESFISRIAEKDADNISDLGKDYFIRIQNAANRARQLISDLLLYSQTNSLESHFTPVDLNVLLAKVMYELRDNLIEKDATIELSRLPVLHIIEFQFHQLFINLITNALKFSKAGVKQVIRVSYELVTGKKVGDISAAAAVDEKITNDRNSDRQYHKISVSDNGIGFDSRYAEKIFTIFQRLHNRDEYAGTGIGLAICRKITENHNGVIVAEGIPDIGSSFHIFLSADNEPVLKNHQELN